MNYSFIKLNFLFFFLLVLSNFWFYFFKSDILIFKNLLFLNLFLISFLLILNTIFYKKLKDFMQKLGTFNQNWDSFTKIEKQKQDLTNFKENNDLEKLLKRYILKSNIDKKNLDEVKSTFMKFLPKQIYDEIGEKWYERIALWNFKMKNISVMFIDIAGFTSISEKINHERALFLLNLYFDWIGEIILKNKWYIDKYLGDWIMVIFDEWYEENAIVASIEIQEFIEKFKMWDLGKKITVWIWINSWEVIVWTVWTKKRMEATVLGDTVNIASRLEDLTRGYDKNIIISESVYKLIENKDKFSINFLWKEALRWKEKEISFYWVDSYFVI
jgi:class 3 adenylate cyclase